VKTSGKNFFDGTNVLTGRLADDVIDVELLLIFEDQVVLTQVLLLITWIQMIKHLLLFLTWQQPGIILKKTELFLIRSSVFFLLAQ
jgi:hypothetical protein